MKIHLIFSLSLLTIFPSDSENTHSPTVYPAYKLVHFHLIHLWHRLGVVNVTLIDGNERIVGWFTFTRRIICEHTFALIYHGEQVSQENIFDRYRDENRAVFLLDPIKWGKTLEGTADKRFMKNRTRYRCRIGSKFSRFHVIIPLDKRKNSRDFRENSLRRNIFIFSWEKWWKIKPLLRRKVIINSAKNKIIIGNDIWDL